MNYKLRNQIEDFYNNKVYISNIIDNDIYIQIEYYLEKTLYPLSKRIIHFDIEKKIVCKFDVAINYSCFTHEESEFYKGLDYRLCKESNESEDNIYSISKDRIDYMSSSLSMYTNRLLERSNYLTSDDIYKLTTDKKSRKDRRFLLRDIVRANLKQKNLDHDIKQTVLLSGVPKNTFMDIYNGKSLSTKSTLIKICNNLGFHESEKKRILVISGHGVDEETRWEANKVIKDCWDKKPVKISIENLASASEVSDSTIKRIKRIQYNTNFDSLLKVSVALLIDANKLIEIVSKSGYDYKNDDLIVLILCIVEEALKNNNEYKILKNYVYGIEEYKEKFKKTLEYYTNGKYKLFK